jgi:flagellar protein FliL
VAAAADKKKTDAKDAPKSGSKTIVLIAVAAVVAAAAAGGGAWFFASHKSEGEHAKEAPKTAELPKPAQYFAMDPPFVVNLAGPVDGPRYLQVEVQLMTRDPEELKAITENAPAIRAHLLMLLSQVQAADIAQIDGRRKLQAAALADAQKVMTGETGKKCVEDLLFTSFVTQ